MQIDKVNRDLLHLMNERAVLVKQVADLKEREGFATFDPDRENSVVSKMQRLNYGPLSNDIVGRLFRHLMLLFREWEEEQRRSARIQAEAEEWLMHQRVAIVGLGLMGGSAVLALKKNLPRLYIAGYDRDPQLISSIAERLDLHTQNLEKIFSCDVILLALPVGATVGFLKEHAKRFRPGQFLIDMASTKRQVAETAKHVLDASVHFFGGHPLAGKADPGAENADPLLYLNRPFLLTAETGNPNLRYAESFVRALGANPMVMSPEDHDAILANTSHLPQMISTALTLAVAEFQAKSDLPLVHGPALKDMTRLAVSNYEMWKDIALSNSDEMNEAIDHFVNVLRTLQAKLVSGQFENDFAKAKDFKKDRVS